MANTQEFQMVYSPDAVIKARAKGARGKITDFRDFRPSGDELQPFPKGVYDPQIFGDFNKRKADMTERDFMDKWGYIDLGFYMCAYVRKDEARDFIKNLKDVEWMDKLDPVLQAEYAQFNVTGSSIIVTEEINDYEKCGWDGLVKALLDLGRPEGVELRETYLNRYVPVTPVALRPLSRVPGCPPRNHAWTQAYRSILWELDILQTAMENNKVVIEGETKSEEVTVEYSDAMISAMRFHIRRTIDIWQSGNKVLAGGKQNFSRSMQNNRIVASGRAVIIPDPTLKIDEVGIPVHLAYEMCDKWFIQYLQYKDAEVDENGEIDPETTLSFPEANKLFLEHSAETMKLFQYYIAGLDSSGNKPEGVMKDIIDGPQLCYVNRQP